MSLVAARWRARAGGVRLHRLLGRPGDRRAARHVADRLRGRLGHRRHAARARTVGRGGGAAARQEDSLQAHRAVCREFALLVVELPFVVLQLLPATAQPSMLALPIRMKSWSSSLQSALCTTERSSTCCTTTTVNSMRSCTGFSSKSYRRVQFSTMRQRCAELWCRRWTTRRCKIEHGSAATSPPWFP